MGKQDSEKIAQVIKSSLEEIAEGITWEDVPGTTIESCGNYKDHSLHSAKEWAKLILSQESLQMPLKENQSNKKSGYTAQNVDKLLKIYKIEEVCER